MDTLCIKEIGRKNGKPARRKGLAYFKDLNEAMKDEIITRTAYDIKSGRAVPFPEELKSGLAFN